MTKDKTMDVIQADRDAAANLIEAYWQGAGESHDAMRKLAQSYRAGHTQGVWAKAFARHRLQSTTQRERVIEGALKEAEEVFAMVEKSSIADPYIVVELRALCERAGYGNVMASASELWRSKLAANGLEGGEFVAGPCRTTVTKVVNRARQALSTLPEPDEAVERAISWLVKNADSIKSAPPR